MTTAHIAELDFEVDRVEQWRLAQGAIDRLQGQLRAKISNPSLRLGKFLKSL